MSRYFLKNKENMPQVIDFGKGKSIFLDKKEKSREITEEEKNSKQVMAMLDRRILKLIIEEV